MDTKRNLSLREFCTVENISIGTLYNRAKADLITITKDGRRSLITPEEQDRYRRSRATIGRIPGEAV